MKRIFNLSLTLVLATGLIFSCEGPEGPAGQVGEAGEQGPAGSSALVNVTQEAAGDNCSVGGFRIDVGTDTNGNGSLDADEITGTAYTCTGESGTDYLINTIEIEPGDDNCPSGGFTITAGLDANGNGTLEESEIEQNIDLCTGDIPRSGVRPLVTLFGEFLNTVSVTNLIHSEQTFPTADGGEFVLGGSADGAGMVEYDADHFALMVNLEDHYSVVRLIIEKESFEVVQADYMVNSGVSDYARQCSGTMWEAAIHGGSEDFFISASETWNYTSKRIDIDEAPAGETSPVRSNNLTGFGRMAWENNVPLPAVAYPGQTVVVGGDDDSSSGTAFGQISIYHSDAGDADIDNGKIYVMRSLDDALLDEGDIAFGQDYAVEFVEIANGKDLGFIEMGQACLDSGAFQFMRVEDLDYGKGSAEANRTIYFAVTGRGPGRGTFNDWGTGYKLVLDANNPLQGTLTQIVSGNVYSNNRDGNMPSLQSPDNICVTDNYIYWQEDPNSFDRGHQAYIWQTDLNGNNPKAVLQIDFEAYLEQDGSRDSDGFNGEFGAMFDISDKVNEDGTFVICLQPHYWENPKYEGIDGHFRTDFTAEINGGREDDQGSQLVVLRGLPR